MNKVLFIFCVIIAGCCGQQGCDRDPCLHGGTCIDVSTDPYFRCLCSTGYTGLVCQDDVDECLWERPCRNGGLCVNRFGGYDCHCGPSWAGKQCEILVKKCAAFPCYNGATCTDVGEDFYCTCATGFTGAVCDVDINECNEAVCVNGATCMNTNGSYGCQCVAGYTGSDCETDIDECSLHTPCMNNGTCRDLVNGYVCICQADYKGLHCSELSQECNNSPCIFGSCRMTSSGSLGCVCNPGYAGPYCDVDIQECSSNPCVHGDCVDRLAGYVCYCWSGYEGDNCDIDIDECVSNPCSALSTCVDMSDGYSCLCPAGYSGVHCSMDVDECLLYSPCLNGATCTQGVDNYSCECLTGFMGVNCSIDIDDCSNSPCANGNCVDKVGAFTCACHAGWQGALCDHNIDECSTSPCYNNATCTDYINSYTCTCTSGYTGPLCDTDIDDCEGITCNNGSCVDDIAAYRCLCTIGYTGTHCEEQIDDCATDVECMNGGTCMDRVNNYTCLCTDGYAGRHCELLVDKCHLLQPCWNGARCEQKELQYQCVCQPGWTGRHCEGEIDECVEFTPCYNNATCEDIVDGYICHCLQGFNGSRCEIDIDECYSSPCHQHSTCVDSVNSYRCLCSPGFTGEDCEMDINECSSNPCLNGGVCSEPTPGSYECNCSKDMSGSDCDLVSSVHLSAGGYIQLVNTDYGDTLVIQLSYVSLDKTGVLLWASATTLSGHPQQLLLELYKGSVYVHLETGSDSVSLSQRVSGATVQLIIGSDGVALSQPPIVFTEDSPVTGTSAFLHSIHHIYLGAPDVWTPYLQTVVLSAGNFQGCVGNLTVNGDRLYLSNSSLIDRAELGCRGVPVCPVDYCGSLGSCTPSWSGDYICTCPQGFSGPTCQIQLDVEVVSSQLLRLNTSPELISSLSFVLSLRNASQQGVVMYTDSGNKIALAADNGSLVVYLLGVGYSLTCSLPILHEISLVQLYISDYSMTLRLQNVLSATGVASCSKSSVSRLEVTGPLFIGSLEPNPVADVWVHFIGYTQGLSGCIGNLTVSNELLSFSQASTLTAHPLSRCTREDLCVQTTPCSNGAVCTGLWHRFECRCTDMYSGERCAENIPVTFDGVTSAVTIAIDPYIHPAVLKGSVRLRTRAVENTVLYARYDPSYTVTLRVDVDGSVQLFIISSGGSEVSVRSRSRVNDGEWVDVSWSVDRDLTLTVGTESMSLHWIGYEYIYSNSTVNVVIGAQLYTSGLLTEHFEGCISSLQFYNRDLNLLKPDTSVGVTGSVHHVISGCHSNTVCTHNSCPTNSYCVDEWNQYRCLCTQGWQGDDCSVSIDDCVGVNCNHGSCMDGHLSSKCGCDYGYTGAVCNATLSACDSMPCVANHTTECIATPPLQFVCNCLPGYHGDICEQEVNECDSHPCLNGGSCVDGVNSYGCGCMAGWTDSDCSTNIDDCKDRPCASNSQCIDLVDGYTCVCAPGLTGSNCSMDIEECAEQPCMYGSVCMEPQPGTYECVCPSHLTGSHCEHVRSVNFLKPTHMKLPPLAAKEIVTVIEFTFSTTLTESALLFLAMNEELYQMLAIMLADDQLHLLLDIGLYESPVSIIAPLTPDVYGVVVQQVQVKLLWQTGKVQLTLPTSPTVYDVDGLDLRTVNLNSSVYLAGVDRYTPFMRARLAGSSSFIGCLSDYIINSQPISFQTSPAAVQEQTVALGCWHTAKCNSSSCSYAGSCKDYWTHANCTCKSGYTGPSCGSQSIAEFSKDDSLHFPSLYNLTDLGLSIAIHPSTQQSGVVLYTVPLRSSALALYVNATRVTVVVLSLGQNLMTTVDHPDVNNGDWCSLALEVEPLSLLLHVTCEGVTKTSTIDFTQHLEFNGPLYLGSVHSSSAQILWADRLGSITDSITACIGPLTVNGNVLDLLEGVSDAPTPLLGCSLDISCQDPKLCSSNGRCVSSWDVNADIRCDRDKGFVGTDCSQSEPLTFDGKVSLLTLTVRTAQAPFDGSGSFTFRTRATAGTLLYMTSLHHSLKFSLNAEGHLLVTTATEQRASLEFSLNDGNWHKVGWSARPLMVSINSSLSTQILFTDRYGSWYDDGLVTVSLGAEISNTGSITTSYWKGCIGSLTLSNQLISTPAMPQGITYTSRQVVSGCHGDVQCTSADVCPSNAFCVDEWNSFSCGCLEGWEGTQCQDSIDDCTSHRCVNGVCVDGHMNYTCLCNHGYTGEFCDDIIHMCNSQLNLCSKTHTLNCIEVFPLNYTCQCKQGWTGIYCTEEVNECSSEPCLNGAQCVDQVNGFSCLCTDEYFGSSCEQKHICTSSICKNGGTCVPSEDNSLYVCQCTGEYLGESCDVYNACYLNECQHGSACLSDALNRVYSCSCPAGYYGNRCESVDFCMENRCQHGAVCNNLVNKYECTCTLNYVGEFCSTVRDKCTDNSCMNGASCYFDFSLPESNYICLCATGYTGELCSLAVDECSSSPCYRGTCTDGIAEYLCTCEQGWVGDNCNLDVNECVSNPCNNGGECVDEVNGYSCTCAEGYSGPYCDLDYRGCRSSPCINGATCVSERGDNSYNCLCPPGFQGDFCEENIDDCRYNLCQFGSACEDHIQGYICVCAPGYFGEFCTERNDSCYSQPCTNSGVCSYIGICTCPDVNDFCGFYDERCQTSRCQALVGCSHRNVSYSCDCSATSYAGAHCEVDIDECAIGSHTCLNSARCVNEVGTYSCDCAGTGYRGDNCDIDIDECAAPLVTTYCRNGGTCINHSGSYVCICLDGWTGADCTSDIQECVSNPCGRNSTCIEGINGYLCLCPAGYTGTHCNTNIDECQGRQLCRNGGRCIDTEGSYYCTCTEYTTGERCEIYLDTATTTSTSSPATSSDAPLTTSSLSQQVTDSGSSQTALIASLTVLAVVLCAAVVAVILYRHRCLSSLKGSYRPDSMTALPMSMHYTADHRQMLK